METNEEQQPKHWTLPVDEEGVLILPDELWDALGWKENDTLEWVDQQDGSFLIVKVEDEPEESQD